MPACGPAKLGGLAVGLALDVAYAVLRCYVFSTAAGAVLWAPLPGIAPALFDVHRCFGHLPACDRRAAFVQAGVSLAWAGFALRAFLDEAPRPAPPLAQ